jgi:DNA-binding response OmpR family regulator
MLCFHIVARKVHILLVDDDATGLQIRAALLESRGFQVDTASNPPSALAAIRGREFDLAIIDQILIGTTGDELAGQIRAILPQLPIILHSGLMSHEMTASIRNADVFVSKADGPTALLAAIGLLLREQPGNGVEQ